MEFRTLGEFEVWDAGRAVPLRGAVQRSVLALLLLRLNTPVRTVDLVEELWGAAAPPTAAKMVQNAVSKLRQNGFGDVIATRAGGYVLQIDAEQIDSTRFERLVDRAREALASGAPEAAQELLQQANAMWRGPPLADLASEPFVEVEIARLEELHLEASECAVEASLALGRHREVAQTLEGLIARHPLRETLRQQLMLSLYRSGRQAEALAAYRAAREYLRDEVGLEPSPALQRLEQAILLQDPMLEAADLETSAIATHALRKTITVVHGDLTRHGPALDPETLLALSARITETLRATIAAHGGSIAATTDLTFVAVFGLPVVNENDALRAARAALDAQSALATINVAVAREWDVRCTLRLGIATGTALIEAGGTGVATGEVFAVAARLAHAAREGDVLLAQSTRAMLRAGVGTQPVADHELSLPEPAWRLLDVSVDATSTPRETGAPFVGRDWELAQLRHALERATGGTTSYLVTVLGPAGIGKSRLAHEFANTVAGSAKVLTGRCPSYGAGVTFWPLAEIVREAAGGTTRDAIGSVVASAAEADEVAARIAGALGAEEPTAPAEELFWAVRVLFTALAAEQPLVVILDDLQWAEPMLLDLLEHVADAIRDAPVLLLCLARSELLDSRPGWAGGKLNASTILLEPLRQVDRELLIAHAGGAALDGTMVAKIAETAEGNPLFLEQMVAMAVEEGAPPGQLVVPPTIQALLAARLDRLEAVERAVLERASVVGREFARSEVAALSPAAERDGISRRLAALARRELLTPAVLTARGDATFRFRHGLIRDAAYDALPMADRAMLHERLGRFLERTPDHPARGHDEVLAFHLEQAYRYRVELGQSGDEVRTLADEAAGLLAGAGQRAYARDDVPAAVALLERAAKFPRDATRKSLEVLPDLGEAIRESGDYARAEAVLTEAIVAASAERDTALEEYARLLRLRMRVQTDVGLGAAEVISGAKRALAAFADADDAHSLAKAWELLAWGHWLRCRAADSEDALARSLEDAKRAGDRRTEAQSLHLLLGSAVFGPRPVPDGIARCEEILASHRREKRVTASALRALAALKAMAGDFNEARSLLQRFSTIVEEIGLRVTAASAAETYAEVELLAGDPAAAERRLRLGYEELGAMGESSTRANLAALLAQALHAQGRDDEAVAVSDVTPADDDVSAHVHLAAIHARALAAIGRFEEAERVGLSAVERARTTDFLVMRADAIGDLADVLRRRGRTTDAQRLLEQALQLYRRKQHIVAVNRTQDLLTALVQKP